MPVPLFMSELSVWKLFINNGVLELPKLGVFPLCLFCSSFGEILLVLTTELGFVMPGILDAVGFGLGVLLIGGFVTSLGSCFFSFKGTRLSVEDTGELSFCIIVLRSLRVSNCGKSFCL